MYESYSKLKNSNEQNSTLNDRFVSEFIPKLICNILELLKNSIVEFNKTTSIDSFHTTEIDGELIFQQLYFTNLYKIEYR
ncbi:hypothetical protein AR546_16305 [Leptospira interrogans serovar Canicola]|nr:hypothetical protein AR546_16305 [Leptospira interrogans serovar Canicola]OMH62795.1 hypothetical protein BW243_15755 [Leptospira interrogans serovar Pomona]POR16970.1 hypothetical protein B0T34_17250 [Leptospira interrogans serovar Canicola]